MSYINLSEFSINVSTTFFNQLDTDHRGLISLQQIYDACFAVVADQIIYYPPQNDFIPSIISMELLSEENPISQEQYETLQTKYSELNDNFNTIDTDNNGFILVSELFNHYKKEPQTGTPTPPSYDWLENLKKAENLTNESQITLEQLLTYENTYNTMRYWPINQTQTQ